MERFMSTITETSDKGNSVSVYLNKTIDINESEAVLEIIAYLSEILILADELIGDPGVDPNYDEDKSYGAKFFRMPENFKGIQCGPKLGASRLK